MGELTILVGARAKPAKAINCSALSNRSIGPMRANIDTAAEGLPQLMANLTAVSDSVKALPLDDLVKTGTGGTATPPP